MPSKYIVRLTAQEREICRETIRKLNGSSEKVRRAQMLVKADADGPAWTDQQIADAFSCRTKTVENVRQRCVLEGFEQAAGAKTAGVPPGPQCCSAASRRQSHHRPRLVPPFEGLRELVVAPAGAAGRRVGDRRVDQPRNHPADAKKNGMTQRKIQYWVIPPQADAEFVAHMEQVLDLYQKPYDPACPSRVHGRAAGAVGQGNPPADGGHEEPSPACRLRVRTGRHGRGLPVQRAAGGLAAGDGPGPAYEGGLGAGGRRPVGRTHTPNGPKITLSGVRPPQHAHQGSLLRSVPTVPARENEFVALEFRHEETPKHGSRQPMTLNIAENELQFDARANPARAPHRRPRDAHDEVSAWSTYVNGTQRGVDWPNEGRRCAL